jgi:hypothetical protein
VIFVSGFKSDIRSALDGTIPLPVRSVFRRQSSVLHRSLINAVDKLVVSSAALVSADVALGGHLTHDVEYKSAYSPSNEFGPGGISSIGSVSTADDASDTHMVDVTIPQVVGAAFYDVFFSTDAAPLWVARVTEAQRAAGALVSAVGTVVSPSAGVAAGDVRCDAVGTGIASNNGIFSFNNGYVLSGITGVDTSDYTLLVAHVYFYVADYRSVPSLSLVVIFEDDAGNFYVGDTQTVAMLTAIGHPLYQSFQIDCVGAAKTYILIDSLAGQSAQVSIRCEKL